MGNGLTTLQTIDRATGTLEVLTTGPGVQATVQNLEFDWDKAANLKVRRDQQANKREEFDYDGLYRLTQSRLYATVGGGTASATDNNTYDTIGNLTNKGGASPSYTFSSYNYGTRTGCSDTVIRPHAVYQVNAAGTVRRYCYDANGNVSAVSKTSGTGPLIYDATTWWVANLAKRISQGGTAVYSDFWYGPNRERIQQTAKKSASVTETTLYVGDAYEKVTRGSTTEHVHYIRGGGDTVAIYKKIAGGSTETRYLHRDHLGSVVAATDATGAILERYSFDPWGKRRDPATWVAPAVGTFSYDPAFNDRGYTGHEHIDHLGLVNMNGRVYDPEIGRFLSADPFVQFPASTQGFNRYTYVGNNPLSYTDPSGFFGFKSFLKVVGFALNFVPGFQGWGNVFLRGFITGFLMSGGDLRAGLMGAFGAPLFASAGVFASQIISATVQGVLTAAMGGKFKQGFFSAFANGIMQMSLGNIGGPAGSGNFADFVKRVIRDAVIGGVSAELGGGKFKNGAAYSAFGSLTAELATSSSHIEEDQAQNCDMRRDIPDETIQIMVDNVEVTERDGATHISVSASARSDRFMLESDASQYFDAIESYWSGSGEFRGHKYSMTVTIEYLGPIGIRGADIYLTGVSSNRIGWSHPSRGLMGITGNEYPSTPAHEFGHMLGLGHRVSGNSIMNCGHANRGVTGYDYSRVAKLYRR